MNEKCLCGYKEKHNKNKTKNETRTKKENP